MVVLPLCELEALSPAQVPSPATARIRTASSASQRGWRYQRGPRGRPGGGWAPTGWPGPPLPRPPAVRGEGATGLMGRPGPG